MVKRAFQVVSDDNAAMAQLRDIGLDDWAATNTLSYLAEQQIQNETSSTQVANLTVTNEELAKIAETACLRAR